MTKVSKRWIFDSVVWAASLLFAFGLLIDHALADSKRSTATNDTWKAECASCHLAYPPKLLSEGAGIAATAAVSEHRGHGGRG